MIRILLDGTNLVPEKTNCLSFIPRVGEEIIFRTFRQNKNYKTDEIFDYFLKVEKVIYETEESWNSQFINHVNIIVAEISKIKIDPSDIVFED